MLHFAHVREQPRLRQEVSVFLRQSGALPLSAAAAGRKAAHGGKGGCFYLPGCSWPEGWAFGYVSGRRLCAPGSSVSPPAPSCPTIATGRRRQPAFRPPRTGPARRGPARPSCSHPVPPYLGGLLPSERHLGGHDALPLHHQQAVGTLAVAPAAEPLVSLQARHHAVVAASGALRRAAQLSRLSPPWGSRRRLLAFLLLLLSAPERRDGGLVRLLLHTLHVDLPVGGRAFFSHGSSAAQLQKKSQAARSRAPRASEVAAAVRPACSPAEMCPRREVSRTL